MTRKEIDPRRVRPGETAGLNSDPAADASGNTAMLQKAQHKEAFKLIVDSTRDGIVIVDRNGVVQFINKAALALFSRSEEEMLGSFFGFSIVPGEDVEIEIIRRGIMSATALIMSSDIEWNGQPAHIVSIHDISARKRMENMVSRSKALLQNVVDATPDWLCVEDLTRKVMLVNKPFAEVHGLEPRKMIGLNAKLVWTGRLSYGSLDAPPGLFPAEDEDALRGQTVHNPEQIITLADGSSHVLDTYLIPLYDDAGKQFAVLGYSRDVTEQKYVEQQKQLWLNIFRHLNESESEDQIFRSILELIQQFGGYEAVGIRLEKEGDYPYYEANGFVPGHVELENQLCSYDEDGKIARDSQGNPLLECMCGNIIRGRYDPELPFFTKGGSFWSNCTTELLAATTDQDRQARTRNRCNGEGYESVALIPLRAEDRVIGLLQLNDTRRNRFTPEIITFYEGIANSIGIVLTKKQARIGLEQSHASLKKTLDDAIKTMVKIGEMRDPYTAGHQYKVANLATAIAREMKLEETRVDNLSTAAVVHDIGKIYVPSDILSRPGKLTDIEFSLIKTHAQASYDIVKSMDFPDVILQTVLQHHERLDGSGYPNRLKGEDIVMEAKILAVADVVEAMASYRPYRAALGIDSALEEITKNKNKLYDPDAVDACVRLFREKAFALKT
jgi:putative nucleotidyltransferase with HDIG domain/PAS domain S-box-containing protein